MHGLHGFRYADAPSSVVSAMQFESQLEAKSRVAPAPNGHRVFLPLVRKLRNRQPADVLHQSSFLSITRVIVSLNDSNPVVAQLLTVRKRWKPR